MDADRWERRNALVHGALPSHCSAPSTGWDAIAWALRASFPLLGPEYWERRSASCLPGRPSRCSRSVGGNERWVPLVDADRWDQRNGPKQSVLQSHCWAPSTGWDAIAWALRASFPLLGPEYWERRSASCLPGRPSRCSRSVGGDERWVPLVDADRRERRNTPAHGALPSRCSGPSTGNDGVLHVCPVVVSAARGRLVGMSVESHWWTPIGGSDAMPRRTERLLPLLGPEYWERRSAPRLCGRRSRCSRSVGGAERLIPLVDADRWERRDAQRY